MAATFQPIAAFAVERAAQACVSCIRHRRSAAFAGRRERIDAHPFHDEVHERELPPDPLGLRPLSLTRPHDNLRLPERPLVLAFYPRTSLGSMCRVAAPAKAGAAPSSGAAFRACL